MEHDKSILLQKQVKDNTEDLRNEFLDLKHWEEQMKRKDEELRREASGEEALPPVRSRFKAKTKKSDKKQENSTERCKKIKSCDYSSWDKFDVEKACKEVEKGEESDASEEEVMSKEELEKAHERATKHKEEGNVFVKQQKWDKAVGCYSEAIKLFPYDAIFYGNRALCQLKLDNLYSAEADCTTALQLDETYVKAYHRRATARMGLKQYKEAKQDLNKLLVLEPSNREAKSLLAQIEKKLESSKPIIISGDNAKEEESLEKRIAGNMFAGTKAKEQISRIKKDDRTDQKDIILKPSEKYLPIPDWLRERDDVAIIEPIQKPPHLCSKKPLTRIPVEEVQFGITEYKESTEQDSSTDCIQDKPKESLTINALPISKKEEPVAKVLEHSTGDINVPAVPKTSVNFLTVWRRNKSPEFRYKYLKQIPGHSLPKIFQDSMESSVFSDMLEILNTKFVERKEPVFRYLDDLSQVKRFRALIMFVSNADKEGLKNLFEYCKTEENVAEEDIARLRNLYEV